jgi:hypothetical protein
LWTEVSIHIFVRFPPICFLRLWLERSHEALLAINVDHDPSPIETVWKPTFPDSDPEGFAYAFSALSVLIEHIRRWKCLNYHFYTRFPSASLLAIFPFQDAVQLVTLRIMSNNIDCMTELDAFRAIAKLPNLREIHWHLSDYSYLPTEGNLSWHRFKQVYLHCKTLQAAPIIAQCTSAATMHCDLWGIRLLPKGPQTNYSLHKLKVLRFTCQKDGLRLLPELDCPNLEVLGILVTDLNLDRFP